MEDKETTPMTNEPYIDYEDQVCDKEHVAMFGSIVTPAFYSVVIVLSLVGNLLVLIILALYENLKSLTNIFILNMALSDLLFTAILPIWAMYDIWGWIFEEVTCKTVTLVFYAGFYSSMLFLTIMTIQRYIAVVHPLSDFGASKGCCGLVSSLIIWVVSFAVATPALIFTDVQLNPHTNMWHCEYKDVWWKEMGTYQQNLFFVSAFAVMVFCYVRILGKIFKSRSQLRNRTVKLIFSNVAVFFMGWTPYNVVMFLIVMSDHPDEPYECEVSTNLDYAFYVCRLIAFSHCCLNPVCFAFLGVKFRNHLKVILSKVFHRQSTDVSHCGTVNAHSMGSMC
nr:XC chemokine receptor 1-1 [Plecoglossus altivelis]